MTETLKVELGTGEIAITAYSLANAIKHGNGGWEFLGKVLANACNTMSLNEGMAGEAMAEGITREHRTLQQEAIGVLLQTLNSIGTKDPIHTDDRNEASWKSCRKVHDLIEKNELVMHFPFI